MTAPGYHSMKVGHHGPKRLTGAALYAKVANKCRLFLVEFGLPVDEYTVENVDPYSLGSDMQPILAMRFTHKATGHTITFDQIYPGDDGEIDQFNAPEMR